MSPQLDLSQKRVLVTGAAGFVGGHVLARLTRAGVKDAIALVRPGETAAGPAHTIVGDVSDPMACARLIADARPDAVIHLAAIAAPSKAAADRRLAWTINFGGVVNMVEALFDYDPNARFVFAGSSESYGTTFARFDRPLTEDDAFRPLTVYAATKAAADLYVGQMAAVGFHAVRFRAFNHSGPGQSADFVLPAFARQIARIERGLQEPVIRVGNLETRRDFLDVRDVADAYVSALGLAAVDADQAFNLASGRARRIGDLLQMLLSMTKAEIGIEIDSAKLRGGEIALAAGDASKASRVLGWSPKIPIETTLADVLDDWRKRTAS